MMILSIDLGAQNVRRFQDLDDQLDIEDKIRVANELFEKQQYFTAADFYKQILAQEESNPEALSKLAHIHYRLRDFKAANQLYGRLIELNTNDFPLTRFQYGSSLKSVGQYNQAIDEFRSFLDTDSNDKKLIEKAKWEIKSCQMAINSQENAGDVAISILDPANKNGTNKFAAIDMIASGIIFTGVSSLKKTKKTVVADIDGVYDITYQNRIYATSSADGNIADAELLKLKLPKDHMSIGSPFLTAEGDKLYYTICDSENTNCQIYYSDKKSNNKWSDPVQVPGPIAMENSNTKHLVIGIDDFGRQLMFFSSNRAGGFGGYDLWYSVLDDDGAPSEVINLGPVINTADDEVTPFFDNHTNLLFFSSNGHQGLGELDVYMVAMDFEAKKGKIYNLGYPINSSVDDYYFTLFNKGKSGYISSNRIGAVMANQNAAIDNVYKLSFNEPFTYKNLPDYLAEVNSFEEEDIAFKLFDESFEYKDLANKGEEGNKINAEDISINGSIFGKEGQSENVTVYLLDENNQVIDSTTTDGEGKFRFRKLNGEEAYAISYKGQEDTMANMTFFDKDGNEFLAVNSKDDKKYFRYNRLVDNKTNLAKISEDNISISGALLGNKASKIDKKINLLDKDGNVVATTTTDKDGKFRFRSLTADEDYTVGINSGDDVTANLKFFDKDGNEILSVNSENDKRYFKYSQLEDQNTNLTKLSEEMLTISGSLFSANDPEKNKQVALVDKNGKVVASTKTDKNGKFRFRKLAGDEGYTLKFKGDNDSSANMTFFDKDGNKLLAVNSKEDQKYFAFQPLEDQKNTLTKLVEDNGSISGTLVINEEKAANRRVVLSDDKDNNIAEAITDENGEFKFKNLPSSNKYVLKMNSEDGLMASMDFYDKEDNLLLSTNSNSNKTNFVFQSLEDIAAINSKVEEDDTAMNFAVQKATEQPAPAQAHTPTKNNQPAKQLKSLFKWTMTYSEYEKLLSAHGTSITQDINLRVQIGAFRNPPKGLFNNLNLGEIDEVNSKGLTKFLIGNFNQLVDAEVLRKKAFDNGVNDAFVSLYYKGKRVAILIYDNKNNLVRKYEEGNN